MKYILNPDDSLNKFSKLGGGKALNLARLSQNNFCVPQWFCISINAFNEFIKHNKLETAIDVSEDLESFSKNLENKFLKSEFSESFKNELKQMLQNKNLSDEFLAVRSSGLDEDSSDFSFAGQFSSFLFQKGFEAIEESIKRCWASGFSERALSYRKQNGLPITDIKVGVVIQKMINAQVAGVAFSQNPIHPLDRDNLIISSVWGQGEGLVSGDLDADNFTVNRKTFEIETTLAQKKYAFYQDPSGGLKKAKVNQKDAEKSSLNNKQIKDIAKLALKLENSFDSPQDCEWVIEDNKLYVVQTRPITNFPSNSFFDKTINGNEPTLWDNSNIIESYSGVTTPLTFSFASNAYRQVYLQFSEIMGAPKNILEDYESCFKNLLGLIRGRIYYNLINWYKLLIILPGSASNKDFMETMMGVKQTLKPELASLFDFMHKPPKYSFFKKISVILGYVYYFLKIKTLVKNFHDSFNAIYEPHRNFDFTKLSLHEQAQKYEYLSKKVLKKWHVPIINDSLCMIFFGFLKKLTEKWLLKGDKGACLQNDLLCGEGDLESTEPTKLLMRIADKIDNGDKTFRQWFLNTKANKVLPSLRTEKKAPEILALFEEFLTRFGFRCINELKLEEFDLYDDPSFIIQAVAGYVRTNSYSIADMEKREKKIRKSAEVIVHKKLHWIKLWIYLWILKHARNAVRLRENLRFARTKTFGICRHLFRAMGTNFTKLGLLNSQHDIFYLTIDEILAFIEGRQSTLNFAELTKARKKEFDNYRNTQTPPDRFLTYGAVGASLKYPQILADADLLRNEHKISDDPNLLYGTSCCPGVVEGIVRVVKNKEDAQNLAGEILVAERTDPGWVPLYPTCAGLLIERGSLLSHSAVVARELGLPTIVGISGGMMQRLKSGDKIRMDAGKGEIRILK